MTQEELNALANEFYNYLANQKDFYEVWPSEDDTICVDISWGDWKHDHLRLDLVANNFFKEKGYDILNMDTEVTDEDGSDTYSATHSYRIRKHEEEPKEYKMVDSNSVKVEEESLCEEDNKDALKKERDELWSKMPDCTKDEIQRLIDIRKELGDDEFYTENITREALKEESSDKGNRIAKLIARAYKGMVGPMGGEDPSLKGNVVTFYSQGPSESWIFNDDGSVDSAETIEDFLSTAKPEDYGCESEEELRDYFEEIKHFDSVRDLFDSGLSWFMEVPNEEELLKKIDKILSESLKESVESKVRLENPRPVSWEEMYLRDVCGGDVDEYNELYADSVENDFGDEPCQFFFDVLDDKDNYLGKIGIYLFDGMGMWYEIGFEPNEKYLNKEKLELEDMDLPVEGWFPEEHTINGEDDLLKTEEQAREYLRPYLAKIESALEYSEDEFEDED